LKGFHIVVSRAKFLIGGSITFALLLTSVLSCDSARRHKLVSFFFDGVPPLEAETSGPADVNSQSSEVEKATEGRKLDWYVHEPTKDCSLCHGKRAQDGFSRQTRLIAQVPELCYKCHDDYTASAVFVHGPVAVGECLFCHHHHKSRNEHLLNEPEPELCYLCHDREMTEAITGHLPELSSGCSNCHHAHASSAKVLLKTSLEEKPK
jgi:predicted CXXCH cytochrome family protein